MLCPICLNPALLIGRNWKGRRQWHCLDCNRTFAVRGRRRKVGLAIAAASWLWASLKCRANGGRG